MARQRRNKPIPEEDLEELRQAEIKNNCVIAGLPSFMLPRTEEDTEEYVRTRGRGGHPPGVPNSPLHNRRIAQGQQAQWFDYQHDEIQDLLDNWPEISDLLYVGFMEMADQIERGLVLNRNQRDLKNGINRVRKES
jgi:hypothetical protein